MSVIRHAENWRLPQYARAKILPDEQRQEAGEKHQQADEQN
jgi:hypothetical protein